MLSRSCSAAVALLACLTTTAWSANVAGTVIDSAGQPVAGAKVWLVHATLTGGPKLASKGETDGQGYFSFDSPDADRGSVSVAVLANGYALAWAGRMRPRSDVQLVLERPYPLSGVVLGPQKEPVAGVKPVVTFLQRNPSFDPLETSDMGAALDVPAELSDLLVTASNNAGQFSLAALPAGVDVSLYIQDPRYAALSIFSNWAQVMGGKPIEVPLQSSARIRGHVVRATDGKGVPGVKVAAEGRGGGLATSDQEGAYEIDSLNSGVYMVYLKEMPTTFTAAAVSGVTVAAGATVENVDLKIIPGSEIRGIVRDKKTGQPIAGAAICCNSSQQPQVGMSWPLVYTGEDGRYSLRAPDGGAQIRPLFMPTGWSSPGPIFSDTKRVDVTAAGSPFEINFEAVPTQTVHVEVRNLKGQPMPFARVLVHSPDDYGITSTVTADVQGQLELPRSSARRYLLNACCGDSMTLAPLELRPDDTGPLVLRPADGVRPTVTGTVVGEMGKAIPYAIVRVDGRGSMGQDFRNQWSFTTTTLTDQAGRFSLRSIWPNTALTLRIRAAGTSEQTKEIGQLAPAETRDVGEVVMPVADMVVTGMVLDPDDKPVAQVSMDVMGPGNRSFSRRIMGASGLDGAFRIEGLPREQLMLMPDQFGYDSYSVPFGPDNLKVVVRVIPRAKQILYTHHFTPPLVSETAGFKVTLTALHRYRGFGRNHEPQQCLGLDLEAQAEAKDWLAKQVTAIDDQGHVLQTSPVRYRIEGSNPGRGIELPAEGVTKLSKIMLGDKVLFENVPIEKELTAAP